MTRTLLVANRGEIAVRVLHAAADVGLRTAAVFSRDDASALHVTRADQAIALPGSGAAAYLDADALLAAARDSGALLLHPGYGFLSESASFAERVAAAGITFVGPAPSALATFGDKARARALAAELGVPTLRGSTRAVTTEEARELWTDIAQRPADGALRGDAPPALLVKAVAGGGGRGMRLVQREEDLAAAFARCRSEALAAFGDDRLYVEEFLPHARHVEVQLIGDGSGSVLALGDRDCTLQRRHQKLVEIAPAPGLDAGLRERLAAEAVRLGEAVSLTSLCTIEFLVGENGSTYTFLEANPRVQVEHTVTEEVLGLDLVRLQLQIAAGASLAELGLSRDTLPRARGFAVQLRVNAETLGKDGLARPASGSLTALELPAGQGLRVDTAAFVGARVVTGFDSLLAKVIVHSRSNEIAGALARARRALEQTRIAGVATNLGFLRRLLAHADVVAGAVHTRWVEEHLEELTAVDESAEAANDAEAPPGNAGARVDTRDPLAVLAYGKSAGSAAASAASFAADPAAHVTDGPDAGRIVVRALLQGTVVEVSVTEGDLVQAGQVLAVMSAMKMEHEITAPGAGRVLHLGAAPGDTVVEGHSLVVLEPREDAGTVESVAAPADPNAIRPDLAEVLRRRTLLLDEARPEAVAKRRRTGQRTARENVAQLCDPGSFSEYGGFAIAAQRQRRGLDDLIERTPADGMVTGVAQVNGALVGEERARCAVLAYDYTVLAGTQGFRNHQKKDRLFELAERLRLPVVIFTEGGGGRPGDTDAPGVSALDCMAFHLFGRLSGLVPLVGVVSGRCFAGNAALLGCCDVVIATAGSNIGMGGPAMIEGGGLGVFRPEEVGPLAVQVANGVVDIAVRDEVEAVDVARRYLSYFQGPVAQWSCADQRRLRSVIPENRLRIYEVREVIETLADEGSVLELRRGFGAGMVTALARFAGRPVGIVANDPRHLAGAIDAPAADKAARFLQLCDAFDLPVLFLCDTPGIMVGPEAEKTALVRHCSRLFVIGASLTVPFFTIVLRKSYGLGAQAMGGGSHRAPLFTVAWPTGEFGGMGLEGAVKLGFRKELAAVADPVERQRLFTHMVERAYEHGKALNVATHLEIDDVIDPATSRDRVIAALRAAPPAAPRQGKKRPCVDTW